MPETTAVIEGVEAKSGQTNGRDWTKYALKANGSYYGTFDRAAVEPAYGLEGKPAVIEFTENGKFLNLVSVKPAPEGSAPAQFGNGSYVKAKENPDTQISIRASVAMQKAFDFYARNWPAGTDPTPKNVSERVFPLAQATMNELQRLASLWAEDESGVPF